MMSKEEIEKGVEEFQNYTCNIKRKIMEIENKGYDDVNKLLELNILKNRMDYNNAKQRSEQTCE